MKLNELKPNPGAVKNRKRVGRGIGSGTGKTSGSGQKGQKARTGVAIKGFEGGQMPLYRRLPKIGFTKFRRKKFVELGLDRLQQAIDAKQVDAGKDIDGASLCEAGVIRRVRDGVRLLGNGEIKSKVNITVAGATKSAVAAVEKAGGKVTILKQESKKPNESKKAKADAAAE